MGKNWKKVSVNCKTGQDIITELTLKYNNVNFDSLKTSKQPIIHILKIDAEGHDYEVMPVTIFLFILLFL